MPFRVKLGLSFTLGIVAIAAWFFMGSLGQIGPQRAIAFLGPFTIVSLWIFPEVMRRPSQAQAGDKLSGTQSR